MRKNKIYLLDEEKTIRRRRVAMQIDADFVQMYEGIAKYSAKLTSPWSFKYMFWLVTHMGKENTVDCSAKTMREFIEAMREAGGEVPVLRTIRRSLDELVQENVVIRLNRGSYKINPVIFWSNEIGLRLEHTSRLLEGGHNLKPDENVKVLNETNEQDEVNGLSDNEDFNQTEEQGSSRAEEGSAGAAGI